MIETFFLENFVEFGDLVRSGNLDLHLLKPIDEQFLLSFRYVDWSTVPKVFIGAGMMSIALVQGDCSKPDLLYFIYGVVFSWRLDVIFFFTTTFFHRDLDGSESKFDGIMVAFHDTYAISTRHLRRFLGYSH